MKLPDTRVIVFNVAAGVVTIAALIAVLRSLVHTPALAPCTERYQAGISFSVERGGVLLTSDDLQARLSGKDIGLDSDVKIARIKDGPAPVAIGVTLGKGSIAPLCRPTPRAASASMAAARRAGKTAACLSYSVLLPANFDFHEGGYLPGILGAESADHFKEGSTALLLGGATAASVRPPGSTRALVPSRSIRGSSRQAAG